MGSLTDSGIEAPEGMEIELPQVEDFAGGAEVMDDGMGGAIVQALMGAEEGLEVETEVYDHNANLAEVLDDGTLGEISSELREQYEDDKESRSEWVEAYTKGLDLLGIQYQERTQPFQGASGVTHPLISESVTQFQAQAYKELLPAGGPVQTQIIGLKDQERESQAQRVKEFMNYQITEVMEEFDPDTDQMLFYLPLSGSTFKKVYFDDLKGRAVSKFVPAEDLVVSYSASDLATANRVTHVLQMTENSVRKMQIIGMYRDVELTSGSDSEDPSRVDSKIDEIEGVERGYADELLTILEMHVEMDLEGFEDAGPDGEPTGIKLPYIVTLDHGSGEVLSIRRNFAADDPLKRKRQYFVHYKFLPGLGFYGFGLIHMIGGLGRAATSILRQLIDAGTLANLPSGFKARGIRIRNDDEPLSPGEFRDIDAPGGDIRNSIIPLPFKEPSGTLAQLLGSLIEGGRRFVSIADQQVSNMNQEMPVGTTVAMLERGMKVMSAIHKRLHYAQKNEFRLLAKIFSENLPAEYPYEVPGVDRNIKAADFDGRVDIVPVSDPNIFSMAQRVTLAQTELQLAQSNPQMHNLYEAYKRMYSALEIQNIDEILPPPQEPQPTDPSVENARGLGGQLLQAFPEQDHDAHIMVHMGFVQLPIVQTSPQVLGVFVAHLMEHVALKARDQVQKEVESLQAESQQGMLAAQIGAIDPMLAQQQMQATQFTPEQIEARVAQVEAELSQQILAMLSPQQQQQDPLVAIRQQELAIKASESERRAQQDAAELDLERQKLQQRAMTDAARIELQEEVAEDRADVNRERIQTQRELAMRKG
ncbi:MAG: hypothetical protein CBC65_010380 [Rhodothermaceae bacterium TMED105]|nr:MAG: hypothetical protein CBC65_010380 [Rhodothermaceae bacterium TMED105]|tara:strand:- start:5358 stop:7808 length:2451 start_codon:yes stop_codon:yes gene_type:complete